MSAQRNRDMKDKLPTDGGQFRSFYGNHNHALDDKGRISLPVEFRRVLSEQGSQSIILTNYVSDGSRCLEGFTKLAWLTFEDQLREKSRFNSKLQKLENFYLSRASECQLDSNGRILIPPHLRSYAGLEKEVTFTASIHGFRVWDKRVWEHVFSVAEQALFDNPDIFSDVDIG